MTVVGVGECRNQKKDLQVGLRYEEILDRRPPCRVKPATVRRPCSRLHGSLRPRPARRSILSRVSAPMLTDLRSRRSEIIETARARGASRVRVFGSVARGDATASSDVDFLVDLDEGRGLFDLGGLLMDLQELLGCEVDVVTEAGMRSRVSERVLCDAVDL